MEREKSLNIGTINKYYNFGSKSKDKIEESQKDYCKRGILPASVFNANQYYKYILPSIDPKEGGGYVKGQDSEEAGGKLQWSTTSGYFYCLQGTRELYRQQFLRNRFNYYDSKWQYGSYSPTTLTNFWRINPPPNFDIETTVLNIKTDLD
jgi:hypothetical protein